MFDRIDSSIMDLFHNAIYDYKSVKIKIQSIHKKAVREAIARMQISNSCKGKSRKKKKKKDVRRDFCQKKTMVKWWKILI